MGTPLDDKNVNLLLRLGSDAEDAGDFAHARSCFQHGADLGDDGCWVSLGLMFDLGRGVTVDKQQAMRCYRKAWRRRNEAAANNIAILYREIGKHRTMFSWFLRGATTGDGGAYIEMAKCYRDGIGVRKSPEAVVRCLAAALSHPPLSEYEFEEAQTMLADFRPRVVGA